MDVLFEAPCLRAGSTQEGDEHSSGDEDAGLDWTKLPKPGAAARPIIPKRGEKDFEPAAGGGSGLQTHVLSRSRDAMFEALRANRTISSKSISYGIWYPSIDRVHVTTARGIHFATMGHSASRIVQNKDNEAESGGRSLKQFKRLELLPEEALYLVERGALFCYKAIAGEIPPVNPSNHESQGLGVPMSVQQAFTEMIGREEMTLERYQVYAYLKRLGFILIRAEPPTPDYPVAPPPAALPAARQNILTRWFTRLFPHGLSRIIDRIRSFFKITIWKRPQLHRQKIIQDVFRELRIVPCGHTIPLYGQPAKSGVSLRLSSLSPYKIFFHGYKPSTVFRKTSPPTPDFYIVVVDARTTTMPSLRELTALFDTLPEMPLPPPRKRNLLPHVRQPAAFQQINVQPTNLKTDHQEGTSTETKPSRSRSSCPSAVWAVFQRFFSFPLSFRLAPPPRRTKPMLTPPKPNPFVALKTGKKTVVIAAVDGGNISFFRFGQGVFEEWPMV